MKKNASTLLLLIIFFVGLSVLLYPALSDYWNSKTQSKAIMDYDAALAALKPEDYSALFEAADAYNTRLRESGVSLNTPNTPAQDQYNSLLNINNTGIMGYITIDKIQVELPIYHGTSDTILNVAVGHLENTSLPVGGAGTHSVLSAHRGLPSAKLFTSLDKLEAGDTFTITILNRVLTYEVDRIYIVEPREIGALKVVPGADYCTLVTCTPYGINTHRLLVRGTRIETTGGPVIYVSPTAYRINSIVVTPLVAAPILLVLMILMLVKYRKKEK